MPRLIDGLRDGETQRAHDRLQRLGSPLLAVLAGVAAATATACMSDGAEPDTGTLASASTVGDYTGSGCSTAVVLGLSQQIADEVACMRPGSLAHFGAGGGISFTGSAVLSYLAPGARDDLKAVGAGGGTLQLNSAYRTVAQQYLLYRWYQQGRCGITAAATPGNSNHESGRAVDVGNYSSYVTRMANHHWSHDVPGDPVHFDHLSSPDLRGSDVKAFQRLWNRNHPGDLIAEDGIYGPQTGARIAKAPAGGFAKGPTCGSTSAVGATMVTLPGPLAPGQTGTATIELTNTGTDAWPATLAIATADGAPSPLYDAAHWTSPAQVALLGQDVAPGGVIDLDLSIVAPPAATATHVDQMFVLTDGTTAFGAIALTVQVVPPGDDPTNDVAPEAPEPDDGGPVLTGGCAAGGGGGGAGALALIAPLAVWLRGQRRKRR